MWYQNIGSLCCFRFVTKHACDRRTDEHVALRELRARIASNGKTGFCKVRVDKAPPVGQSTSLFHYPRRRFPASRRRQKLLISQAVVVLQLKNVPLFVQSHSLSSVGLSEIDSSIRRLLTPSFTSPEPIPSLLVFSQNHNHFHLEPSAVVY